jgi:hypothetical protein
VPVSIGLYFSMFWITWKIAVRITEPKSPAVVNANSEGGTA